MPDIDLSGSIFAAAARVSARATSAELLALAREGAALDPAVFDEYPPFFFRAEISSTRLDAYYTHMDPATTLVNFARDAAAGVSFLAAHNARTLPFGRSLTGELAAGEVVRVLADFYTIPGLAVDASAFGGAARSTEQIIVAMRAGIQKDVSVGFFGGWWKCDVCGNDLMDWRMCTHFPGLTYEVKGPDGVQRNVLATATVIDAHLAEVSAVYDGATPGAEIIKAQSAAEGGRMTHEQARLVEQRYRIKLPDRRVIVPGATVENPMTMTIGSPMSEQQPAAAAADPASVSTPATEPQSEQRAAPDVGAQAIEEMLTRVREIALAAGAPADQSDTFVLVRWMAGELARLRPLADEGREYRAVLIDETVAEGVRALGTAYGEETQRALLAQLPLATVREMRATYKQIGDARLPGGRVTVDGAPREPKPQPALVEPPATVYQD